MTIKSPSKTKSRQARMLAYNEASEKVGEIEINRLERVMSRNPQRSQRMIKRMF